MSFALSSHNLELVCSTYPIKEPLASELRSMILSNRVWSDSSSNFFSDDISVAAVFLDQHLSCKV